MNQKTIYRTVNGIPVYRADDYMSSRARAMQKAFDMGYNTLFAHEPNGRVSDLSGLLQREYYGKIELSPLIKII